jgi:hypothetical protein
VQAVKKRHIIGSRFVNGLVTGPWGIGYRSASGGLQEVEGVGDLEARVCDKKVLSVF